MIRLPTPWDWVLAIHLLSIVAWVGGMFFAIAVLRPSVAALDPAQRVALHNRVFRRFFLVIWHAMPLTLIAGYAMIVGVWHGFAALPWNVNAMQGLGLIMAAIFLIVVFGPYRRMRRAVSTARAVEAIETIRKLITLNVVLGAITIVIAAVH